MPTNAQKNAQQPGVYDRMTAAFPLPVTAVANTDFQFSLPAGARNVNFRVVTSTAYGAVTDAQLSIGKTVGGAEYVAATTIKAQGVYTPALVTTGAADLDTYPGAARSLTTLNARIAQSGGNSATGVGTLFVDYSLPVS